jgi:hypothetical protein
LFGIPILPAQAAGVVSSLPSKGGGTGKTPDPGAGFGRERGAARGHSGMYSSGDSFHDGKQRPTF